MLNLFEGCMLMLQQSSNHAYSPGDDIVPNVPRMSSPVAQDSAGQSRSQLSDSSLFQRSEEDMFAKSSGSPWLAREIERIPQNELRDLNTGPVEERSIREDLIRQTKTASKEHDSAITKHLVKKAAVEEKLKVWQLDSAVSNTIDDGDGCGGDSFQSGLAIEKRIRELKEASKRQDLAIQKHNTKKAALERGIKRHLDSASGQPSKKPVLEADQELDVAVPGVHQNAERIYWDGWLRAGREEIESCQAQSAFEFGESIERHRLSVARCYSDRDYLGYTVQEPKQQTPFKEVCEQPESQLNLEYTSGGPASPGRSFANWLLRRRPSSFGSVMDGMFKKFEQVAIGAWPARKARHKRAVPVDDLVKT